MKEQPKYYAFFDVDNTIIKLKSMRSFLKYFYKARYPIMGRLYYKMFELGTRWHVSRGVKREFLNKRNFKKLKGNDAKQIQDLCYQWFGSLERVMNDLLIAETVEHIKNHKKNGGEVVFVSGAFEWCLEPIAKRLGVNHWLSIKVSTNDGVLTGDIVAPQTIGQGKVEAIKEFINKQASNDVDLSQCYAYGDHFSDLPMLSYVGNPFVVEGDAQLELYAKENNWPVLSVGN